jgi:hypothetical protein
MSWFSLLQSEKSVFDSQSFFESTLSGGFIGKYVVNRWLNNNQIYVKIKETAAAFFFERLRSRIDPISKKISNRILIKIIHGKNSPRLFPGIAKKALINALEPFCKEVVKNGIKIFIQKEIEETFDTLMEKKLSIAIITSAYSVATIALTAPLFKNSPLSHSIIFAQNYLPAPSMILTAFTTLHVAQMIRIIWKTQLSKFKDIESNKDEVKRLLIDQTRDPIKLALQEKRSYKALRFVFNEERIDAFIAFLIDELIDHYYWKDLQKIQFLKIPLVH